MSNNNRGRPAAAAAAAPHTCKAIPSSGLLCCRAISSAVRDAPSQPSPHTRNLRAHNCGSASASSGSVIPASSLPGRESSSLFRSALSMIFITTAAWSATLPRCDTPAAAAASAPIVVVASLKAGEGALMCFNNVSKTCTVPTCRV